MNNKKKATWQQVLSMALVLLLCAGCVFLMTRYFTLYVGSDAMPDNAILFFAIYCAAVFAAIYLQLIIHEGGHLIFGLLSGYRFTSFRIGSLMWIKQNGNIKCKKLSIAGTAGQCLMSPPDMKDRKIPVALYNFGGSILNAITGIAFVGLSFAMRNVPILAILFPLLAVFGFILAFTNGIPMRTGTVDNDGYNALSVSRSSEAMRSFWLQLKVNEQMALGVRLRDMPDDWFTVPSDEAMKNSLTAVMGVFACNRLMDEGNHEEADTLMEHLLKIESGMMGLYRNLLVCDRMYIELTAANRAEVVEKMLDKQQKSFMKQMKSFPSVLRTAYAYALLGEKDVAKAERIKEQYEKQMKAYPYPTDAQAERALMERAEKLIVNA